MAEPTLEGLPTELLILILFQMPDQVSLRSAVLSSPKIHQAYLTVREQALTCILQKEYGELMGEAIAAIRSRGLFFVKYKEEAIALLDIWRRKHEISELGLSSARIDKPSNMEEIMGLIHFSEVLRFFFEDYTVNLPRPDWIEHDQWEKILPIELSSNERLRFLRALCRLQTHSNIFADGESGRDVEENFHNTWWQRYDGPFDANEEAYRVFYGTLPPWEYDEMGCVWAYLKTKFDPVYKVVSDSVRDLVERHGNSDPRCHDYLEDLELPSDQLPVWWGEINSVRTLDYLPDCTDSLAALGPSFLYRLLHAEPSVQRDMVLANAITWRGTFIGRVGTALFEDQMLPFIYPADRHAVKDFDQFWSTLPPVEQPNRAWKNVALVAHTPEENFEDVVDLMGDQETGWDWGIVIWDDERLKSWDAPDLQRQQRVFPVQNPQ